MLAQGMLEKCISQLAKEKLKYCVQLSKVHQHRQVAQQQLQGTSINGFENDTYDMAQETRTPDVTRTQKSRSDTSNSQTTLDKPTTFTAMYSPMQMVSKTSGEFVLEKIEMWERDLHDPLYH
uniref:Uncharacterized protein n=1 Tax=Romanomermis culicivorax TaxID=13658 RepID=A0A915KQY6_ROMCU